MWFDPNGTGKLSMPGLRHGSVLSSPPSLDGSVQGPVVNSGTTYSLTLSTTQTKDIIVLASIINGTTVSGVSDGAGLTWIKRRGTGGTNNLEYWYAVSTGILTNDTIMITFLGSTSYAVATVFGVSGAKISDPFDTSASFPYSTATIPADPISYTTTGPNELVIGLFRLNTTAIATQGSGTTLIKAGSYQLSQYVAQATAGTYSMLGAGNAPGDANGSIVDAFVHA